MGFWEVLLIGIGLSMDAFAAAVCQGLRMRKLRYGNAMIIALFFGGFQALMPFLGWALGIHFEEYIVSVDHWIAFGLLAFLGGKMLFDVIRGGEDEDCKCAADSGILDLKELFLLAIATSIDALAVGISFAFLQVKIGSAVSLIGVTTFILVFLGVLIGHRFGAKYKNKATVAGGVILILIGVKILLEHLGIISF